MIYGRADKQIRVRCKIDLWRRNFFQTFANHKFPPVSMEIACEKCVAAPDGIGVRNEGLKNVKYIISLNKLQGLN